MSFSQTITPAQSCVESSPGIYWFQFFFTISFLSQTGRTLTEFWVQNAKSTLGFRDLVLSVLVISYVKPTWSITTVGESVGAGQLTNYILSHY